MKHELPFLSDLQRRLVQETLNKIVDAIHPEQVLCYGIRKNENSRWSSFQSSTADYDLVELAMDLLIVTHEKDKRKRDSVLNMIESFCSETLNLIAVVHSTDAVEAGLLEGNLFFSHVYGNGVLLYEQKQTNHDCCITGKRLIADERRLAIAKAFYETGKECTIAKRNEIATFLFHQAVEHSCAALLTSRLGYRPTTHSIKRLLSLTQNITPDINALFAPSIDEDLLEILHRSYTDARYKEDYEISSHNVQRLKEKVSSLHDLVIKLCSSEAVDQGQYEINDALFTPAGSFRLDHHKRDC